MDRNHVRYTTTPRPSVALRKESVDRNIRSYLWDLMGGLSLSARRAWIEITIPLAMLIGCVSSLSARRAWIEIDLEGNLDADLVVSLSARRAWIEIFCLVSLNYKEVVALRKESVDRNRASTTIITICIGRSPQGERG